MIINYDNINDPQKSPLKQVRLFHRRSSEPTSPSWVPWSRVRGFGDQKSTRLKRGLAVFPPLDFDGFWHFCGASHFFWWTWMSDVTTATVTYFAMFSWRNRQFFLSNGGAEVTMIRSWWYGDLGKEDHPHGIIRWQLSPRVNTAPFEEPNSYGAEYQLYTML